MLHFHVGRPGSSAGPGETLIRAGHARNCPHFSDSRLSMAARETEHDLSKVYSLPQYCL
jgi:hypothetical protein